MIFLLVPTRLCQIICLQSFFHSSSFLASFGSLDFGSPLMARIRLTARMATLNSSKALEREEHALDSVVVGLYRQFMR
jgi:hypothetical protein